MNRKELIQLIESEVEEQVGEEEDDGDQEETVERVRVKNNESGNSYSVRQDFAFSNPQRYQSIRKIVREEVEGMISEYGRGSQAAEQTIMIRTKLQETSRLFRDLRRTVKQVDPDMVDWTEDIEEEIRDTMDELFKLGNELSNR